MFAEAVALTTIPVPQSMKHEQASGDAELGNSLSSAMLNDLPVSLLLSAPRPVSVFALLVYERPIEVPSSTRTRDSAAAAMAAVRKVQQCKLGVGSVIVANLQDCQHHSCHSTTSPGTGTTAPAHLRYTFSISGMRCHTAF